MGYAPLATLGRYDKHTESQAERYDIIHTINKEKPMFIKNRKKLNNRGFTLIELTIVMAISAVISVMIISFTTLISAQVKKNNLRADFMQEVMDFRTDLQVSFAEIDNGNPITVENNIVKIGNNELSYLESYEYIDTITFDVEGKILKVTVTNARLQENQSFILISKTGSAFAKAK